MAKIPFRDPDHDAPCHFHHREIPEVVRLLGSDCGHGLATTEVANRQEKYGLNRVTARAGTPPWKRFLLQFHAPLVYILLAAATVTLFLHEWVDASVITAVVLVNAIIGYFQEAKAEKAIAALGEMVGTEATVRRDGRRQRVPSAELVPGDVVLLQGGDRVPADLRLFEVQNLHVDEAPLTGESLPVSKHVDPLERDVVLADRRNQAYAGTLVTAGQAEGLVWATGDRTETGRIAWLIAEATEISTPLTRKIAAFSRLLLWVILALAAATFAVGVLRGQSPVEMFKAAVALAVGAIPEGLPAAVTIVLAIGVNRMAKRRAILRKLPAVETLGSTTVICSDKTGTLTQNEMTVQRIHAGGRDYELTGVGYGANGEILRDGQTVDFAAEPALLECLRAGVLCNEAEWTSGDDGHARIQGDPTEAALLVAAAKGGLGMMETREQQPRIAMIPFESEHMFRATLHEADENDDNTTRMIYKVGAIERLLDRCEDRLGPDGSAVPLDRDEILSRVDEMAAEGLRVLAVARRRPLSGHDQLEHGHVMEGLTFLGLQGMLDPPRPEAIEAVANCRHAGVQVKMITGDHAVTARVIATRIGIADEGDDGIHVVTGRELEDVDDADLPALADSTEVFARVAPEQKLRLVRALQEHGHVVAMTGDGVNDAPALKQADIGVAMGISGTDVAKGAADMILADDNFATIEAAVEEGRGVFDNLRKFIVWTIPTNLGEGGIILVSILLGLTLPVLPVQVLWVNMATAVLLGLMLVFEPKEHDLMGRPPRDPARPLLTYPLFMRTGLVALIIIVGGIWLFSHEMNFAGDTLEEARTAVVNVIVFVEIAYLFCCRSLSHSVFSLGLVTNRPLLFGALGMAAAQLTFTYAPFMNLLFHTSPLGAGSWMRILSVALLSLAAVELEKWIRFGGQRGKDAQPD
ncbi:cation-transporting P-type ATPase [Haloferula sp.]|uniref:cation-transporting P-type ATPase n=1 Tax=Haloferula sp. TaxID=2497595 RepID=UPI003C78174E